MTVTYEFRCKKCGKKDRTSNMDFLESITGLDTEELKYCDDHIGEAIEGVTLDLSIGADHTRSEEFRAQREQRQRDDAEVAEAKEREAVRLVETFDDDRIGEKESDPYGESVVIEMPKAAKADLKELGWQASHRRWDDARRVWLADAERIDMIRDHMTAKGWDVEVDV